MVQHRWLRNTVVGRLGDGYSVPVCEIDLRMGISYDGLEDLVASLQTGRAQ
jgi:hypothetical protein